MVSQRGCSLQEIREVFGVQPLVFPHGHIHFLQLYFQTSTLMIFPQKKQVSTRFPSYFYTKFHIFFTFFRFILKSIFLGEVGKHVFFWSNHFNGRFLGVTQATVLQGGSSAQKLQHHRFRFSVASAAGREQRRVAIQVLDTRMN